MYEKSMFTLSNRCEKHFVQGINKISIFLLVIFKKLLYLATLGN